MSRKNGIESGLTLRKVVAAAVAGGCLWMGIGMASAADFSSWQKKMRITFSGYNPPGGATTLTNFPALVALSTNISGFSYGDFMSLTNQDLRFTAADGTSELNYEIEKWDTNGTSHVWLQVSNLVDKNTLVWAFWGKSDTNAPAYTTNGATWDASFTGVWHMAENSGAVADSSRYKRHGTANNGVDQTAAGRVAGGDLYDGVNDHTTISQLSFYATNSFSVEVWYKGTDTAANSDWGKVLLGRDNGDIMGNFILRGGYFEFIHSPDGSWNGGHNLKSTTLVADGNWHHLAYVNYANQTGDVFVDGVREVAGASSTMAWKGTHYPFRIDGFMRGYSAKYTVGALDEARVRAASSSANWIWASWLNQVSNTAFSVCSGVVAQDTGLPQVVNGSSTNVLAASAMMSGALITNGTSDATVYLFCATNDCGTNKADWMVNGLVTNCGPFSGGAVFTNTLSGLHSNTWYSWTHMASNAAGEVWAEPSLSFKTWGPLSVDHDGGATNIGWATATLRGTLLNGNAAYAWALWGTNQAGLTSTSAPVWVTEGVFSVPVTGLTEATTYYYRCFVSNAYDTATSSITNFTTLWSTWYVATNGPAGGDGSSWAMAFTNIQTAIDAASSNGHTICIRQGLYRITARVAITNKALTLRGGYAGDGAPGTFTNDASLTVLDANQPWNGTIQVLYAEACSTTLVENITIRGGASGFGGYGSGIYAKDSAITFRRCVIADNISYAARGVAAYLTGSGNVVFDQCWISNNLASSSYNNGACILVNGGTLRMEKCVMRRNSSNTGGSGVYAAGDSAILVNCLIITNTDYTAGVGSLHLAAGTLVVSNCTVAANSEVGLRRAGGTATAKNSIFWGNKDDISGTVSLSYCNVGDGDDQGNNGNLSVDPLFVDRTYYHLQSRVLEGNYVNGYFSGGSWSRSQAASPLLDAGDPASDYSMEPGYPHGHIELGAYGNTPVASLSYVAAGTVLLLR